MGLELLFCLFFSGSIFFCYSSLSITLKTHSKQFYLNLYLSYKEVLSDGEYQYTLIFEIQSELCLLEIMAAR